MGTPPRAVVVSPRYPGAEQLGPAGAHSTPDLAAHPLPADALEERPGPGRHGVFERPPRPLRYQPRGSTQPPPSHALVRAPGRRLRLAAERDSGTRCAGAAPRSDQVSLGREAKESARSAQRPAAGPRVPAVGRAESGEDAGGVQQHLSRGTMTRRPTVSMGGTCLEVRGAEPRESEAVRASRAADASAISNVARWPLRSAAQSGSTPR